MKIVAFAKVKPVIREDVLFRLKTCPVREMVVTPMPAPCTTRFFPSGMLTVVLQKQVPAGTMTVPPLVDALTAACTAAGEQSEALTTAAAAGDGNIDQIAAKRTS